MTGVFMKLLNMSIATSWLILAVIILRLLLKKAPKRLTCALWILVAVRLVCPVSFESAFSLIPSAETVQYQGNIAGSTSIDTGISSLDQMLNPIIAGENASSRMEDLDLSSTSDNDGNTDKLVGGNTDVKSNDTKNEAAQGANMGMVCSWVWVIGMAGMLLYAGISYIRLKRRVAASIRYEENMWLNDTIGTPFILGVVKPQIYLPAGIARRDEEYVIAHEKAHLWRRDHWWKPLGFVILAVYWFHPLVWIGYILFCRDIELACDETVIRDMSLEDKKNYSNALLSLSVKNHHIAACPVAFGEVGVKARIKQILNYKKPAFWAVLAAIVAAVTVAVCFLTNPIQKKENVTLSKELDEAVMEAIVNENTGAYWEGQFGCEDHVVLEKEENDKEATVYAMVLYEQYSKTNDGFESVSGSHMPVAMSFSKSESGAYSLKEYWIPEDGSGYEDSIHKKFPRRIWNDAIDTSKYIDEQQARCEAKAKEFFEGDGKNVDVIVEQKSFEEAKEYLASYTENDAERFAEDGCFVIQQGKINYGVQPWNEFISAVNNGNQAELVLVQFTTEGDPILNYLYYSGKDFYHVQDASRDKFGDQTNPYEEHEYTYLKVFNPVLNNGDKLKYIALTDNKDLTYEMLSQSEQEVPSNTNGKQEVYELAMLVDGNEAAEVKADMTWHDLAYDYDMSTVLVKKEQVTSLVVSNSKTGEKKTYAITDGSNTFNEIMSLYYALNAAPAEEDMETRAGYAYALELLDWEGNLLQRVTPYTDGVMLDYAMYQSSENGTSAQLLMKLDQLDWQ